MLHNKNGDKGFSMIELVVTIAIMGIVTLASVGIYSWISNSAFKDACGNITDSMSYARTEKLSKSGDWWVEISLDTADGKCVSKVMNSLSSDPVREKKNKKVVTIEVTDDTGSVIPLDNTKEIYMEYNSNGSFKNLYIHPKGAGSGGTTITAINVTYSKYSKTIKLAENTGKFFLD